MEAWRQDSDAAFARRLLVTAMAAVVASRQMARNDRPEAEPLRDLLVRLSGRQLDRARNKRGFTGPMLLAGPCLRGAGPCLRAGGRCWSCWRRRRWRN